jgi:hypothetical protein
MSWAHWAWPMSGHYSLYFFSFDFIVCSIAYRGLFFLVFSLWTLACSYEVILKFNFDFDLNLVKLNN